MDNLSVLHTVAATAALAGFGLLWVLTVARTREAPLCHVRDPSVHDNIAENEISRVIAATWQTGQQGAFHCRPANAAYRLRDRRNRIFKLDGSIAREGEVKAGSVVLQNPAPGHSIKNMSDKVCQSLIVESV